MCLVRAVSASAKANLLIPERGRKVWSRRNPAVNAHVSYCSITLNRPWVRLLIGFGQWTGAPYDVVLRPCPMLLADTRAELIYSFRQGSTQGDAEGVTALTCAQRL